MCSTGDERGRAGFWRLGGFVWRVLSVAFMGNLPWIFQNVVGLFKERYHPPLKSQKTPKLHKILKLKLLGVLPEHPSRAGLV